MYNPFSLEGKKILITGASSGIGQAAAIECSKMGARVIITGRNTSRLIETLNQTSGDGHSLLVCDLNIPDDVERLVSQTPSIDGFISNAGINTMNPIQFIKEEDISLSFQINTISPILLLKKLIRNRKLAKGGSVVFTSSMAGVGIGSIGNGVYTATKGALCSFIKVAALELAPKGIRVNAVCPGMTQTQMIFDEKLQDESFIKDRERYPLGRYGNPIDIAWAMVYLLSDASSWVTGTNLVIDGGLSVK